MIQMIPEQIVQPLLQWYDQHARSLPWRNDPTPYKVWISEIILQQTRVEAGKPYFDRFVETVPDVVTLAALDENSLLKLWEGLGYYNRAKNLQKAAREVMERFDGKIPATPFDLESLPGIGAYTAGAIASIAFQYKVPAVDGNVLRVLSRVTAYRGDVMAAGVKEKTAAALQKILPVRVGDFNQSLMELGATVCLPNGTPKCEECPLREMCKAKQYGIALQLPVKPEKRQRKKLEKTVLLLCCEGRVALQKRPAKGLLANLWEYPCIDGTLSVEDVKRYFEAKQISVGEIRPAGTAKHIFTHLEWHMAGYYIQLKQELHGLSSEFAWPSITQLQQDYPMPSAYKFYTEQLLQAEQQKDLSQFDYHSHA